MRRHFRSALSRKQSLFITIDSHASLHSRKIRKVPDMFTDKELPLIKLRILSLVKLHLKFLREHFRHTLMDAGYSISAVLGDHDRFILGLPEIQFQVQSIAGSIKISGQIVPAIVAVDADDIHAPCDHVFFIVVLTADQSDRTI